MNILLGYIILTSLFLSMAITFYIGLKKVKLI